MALVILVSLGALMALVTLVALMALVTLEALLELVTLVALMALAALAALVAVVALVYTGRTVNFHLRLVSIRIVCMSGSSYIQGVIVKTIYVDSITL